MYTAILPLPVQLACSPVSDPPFWMGLGSKRAIYAGYGFELELGIKVHGESGIEGRGYRSMDGAARCKVRRRRRKEVVFDFIARGSRRKLEAARGVWLLLGRVVQVRPVVETGDGLMRTGGGGGGRRGMDMMTTWSWCCYLRRAALIKRSLGYL